jgi:hypothetical protein
VVPVHLLQVYIHVSCCRPDKRAFAFYVTAVEIQFTHNASFNWENFDICMDVAKCSLKRDQWVRRFPVSCRRYRYISMNHL